MSPAYDFIQEILSHGNDIEVLAPVWLRDLVAKRASEMTMLYEKWEYSEKSVLCMK